MADSTVLVIVQTIAPIAAAFVAYLTLREQNRAKKDLSEIKANVDGKAAELVKASARQAHSDGIAEGVRAVISANHPPVETGEGTVAGGRT